MSHARNLTTALDKIPGPVIHDEVDAKRGDLLPEGPTADGRAQLRAQQSVLVLVVLFGLAGMALWMLPRYFSAGIVDLDDAPTKAIPYVLDVGNASWQDFAQIPGIGEELAKRIVQQRQRTSFVRPDDLLQVRGIGSNKLKEICKYVRFPSPGHRSIQQPWKANAP